MTEGVRWWFRKKKVPPPITRAEGFDLGQIVQHKINGALAVICEIYLERGAYWAVLARGEMGKDECDCRLVELEAYKPPMAEPGCVNR